MANYDPISALMSPISGEDELRALADSLRKRKRAADFYSATTIKPLQQAGQQEGQDVLGIAERQGVLRQALAERKSREAEQAVDNARQQEQLALAKQQAESIDQYRKESLGLQRENIDAANNRADQQTGLRMTLAQMKEKQKPLGALKPPAKVQGDVVEYVALSNTMSELDGLLSGMDKKQKSLLDSDKKSTAEWLARGVSAPLGNVARSTLYPDETVLKYLDTGSALEARLSQLAAGLALTGYEIDQRTTWSPFAPGIDQKQRENRLDRLKREFGSKMGAYTTLYPGYFDDTLAPAIGTVGNASAAAGGEDSADFGIEDIVAGIEDGSIQMEDLSEDELNAVESYIQ